MMRECTYRSSDQKTLLSASLWLPEQNPYRGVIQICHGMVEHMGQVRMVCRSAYLTGLWYAAMTIWGMDGPPMIRISDISGRKTAGIIWSKTNTCCVYKYKRNFLPPLFFTGTQHGILYHPGVHHPSCRRSERLYLLRYRRRNPLIGFALALSNLMVFFQGRKTCRATARPVGLPRL